MSADVPELLVLETVQKTRRDTIYLIQCSAVWSQESETTYQIAKTIVLYVLPLWLMSVAYCQIVRVLWKSDNIPGHTETVQMFNANAYNGRCTLRTRASGGLGGGVFAYPSGVAGGGRRKGDYSAGPEPREGPPIETKRNYLFSTDLTNYL